MAGSQTLEAAELVNESAKTVQGQPNAPLCTPSCSALRCPKASLHVHPSVLFQNPPPSYDCRSSNPDLQRSGFATHKRIQQEGGGVGLHILKSHCAPHPLLVTCTRGSTMFEEKKKFIVRNCAKLWLASPLNFIFLGVM